MEPTQPTQPIQSTQPRQQTQQTQPTQPTQPITTRPQQPASYTIHMHPYPHLHPHSPNNPLPQIPTRKPSTQLLPKKQQDTKSVFLQSVDYGATNQQLQAIFQDCGSIVRVTILKEKITNKPKGCAYVQFAEVESVGHAILLSGIKLRNRTIKVLPKRTNIRGMGNSRGNNQYLLNKLMNSLGPRGGRPG